MRKNPREWVVSLLCLFAVIFLSYFSATPKITAQDLDLNDLRSVVKVDTENSIGTGVVVKSANGKSLVLTAHHVIMDQKRLRIEMENEPFIDAKLISADETNDLALLEVSVEMIPAIIPEKNEYPGVGDRLDVVGCPMGYCPTRTIGFMTGFDGDLMVISASAFPGNSGGPAFFYSYQRKRYVLAGIVVSIYELPKWSRFGYQTYYITSVTFAVPPKIVMDFLKNHGVLPTEKEDWDSRVR